MPTDLSKFVDSSKSKAVANAVDIAKNAQRPGTEGQNGVADALAQQYNKKPVEPTTLKGGGDDCKITVPSK